MLIDTHCHLEAPEFDEDRDAVVRAAQAAGVGVIVVPAIENGNFAAVRDCCRRYSMCFPAYGIHPLFIDRVDAQSLAALRDWLSSEAGGEHSPLAAGENLPLAVGEIGLDFYYPDTDAARQEEIFIAQLKIARDLDFPVLL
ncbi:MAG: TatD family hydrolase, partial [Propionivibrio sp.]